jgi:hypothetical protein
MLDLPDGIRNGAVLGNIHRFTTPKCTATAATRTMPRIGTLTYQYWIATPTMIDPTTTQVSVWMSRDLSQRRHP